MILRLQWMVVMAESIQTTFRSCGLDFLKL